MNNLTDRQKAAIYDDAVEELRYRLDTLNKYIASDSPRNPNRRWRDQGCQEAYNTALDLLTPKECVEYAKQETRTRSNALFAVAAVIIIFAAIGIHATFQAIL